MSPSNKLPCPLPPFLRHSHRIYEHKNKQQHAIKTTISHKVGHFLKFANPRGSWLGVAGSPWGWLQFHDNKREKSALKISLLSMELSVTAELVTSVDGLPKRNGEN